MKMASDEDAECLPELYYSLLEGFLKKEPLLALFHNGTLYVRIRPELWEKDPCIVSETEAETLHVRGFINLQVDVWPIAWLGTLNITISEPITFGKIEVLPIGKTTMTHWEDEHVKIGRNNEHVGIRLGIVEQLMGEKIIQVEINQDEN